MSKLDDIVGNAEIGAMLSEVPILQGLDSEELGKLGAVMEVVSFKDGEAITAEGEVGRDFFLLKEGIALVLVWDEEAGKDVEFTDLGPGDFFGEKALLRDCVRSATVRASGDTEVYRCSSATFASLFSTDRIGGAQRKRMAIQAQRTNVYVQDDSEEKVQEKSEEIHSFLHNALEGHVLFEHLNDEQTEEIIRLMWREEVAVETDVIVQGEEGNHFYVIESGEFMCLITDEDGIENIVNDLYQGSCFGELALMYGTPRAATVQAVKPSVLWVIDRIHFRDALRHVAEKKFRQRATFLCGVELLSPLDEQEMMMVAGALEEESYNDGEDIIVMGDQGDVFYIVMFGTVDVLIDNDKKVASLGEGQFFGERALLKDEPRGATIRAVGKVGLLSLDRDQFVQLLGPLEDLLARKIEENDQENVKSGGAASISRTKTVPVYDDSQYTAVEFTTAKEDLETIGLLGQGSFGLVELVRDSSTKKTYALKTLSKKLLEETEQKTNVQNEKYVLDQLHHPFIVQLHTSYMDANAVYLLMDVSLGGDLFSRLKRATVLNEDAARFYTASLVMAFEYMHSKNTVHRDLKPENVLIGKDGYIKLTDFGFAKKLEPSGTTWTLCGTPDYLAPEIIQGLGHGKAVDWWTVGAVLFEMLASYPPFFDDDPMVTYAKIVRGTVTYPKTFSRSVVDLLKRLLLPKPQKRLGATNGGAALIKSHPWFDGFDWQALANKTMTPPFIPKVENDDDTGNFVTDDVDAEIATYTGDNASWEGFF